MMRGAPGTENWVWSERDVSRLQAAFSRRFGEKPPRTEALFAVAAEGIRIYVERTGTIPGEEDA